MKENNELERRDLVIDSEMEVDCDIGQEITVYIETWFDVDKKFGTQIADEDGTWLNLYGKYNPFADTLRLECEISRDNGSEYFDYMLSFISMHKEGWQKNNYAACCGVSDQVLWQMMKDNQNIRKVYLCLDNDEAGQSAAKRISDKLFIKGIQHEILVPIHKDWNEDLLYPVEESEAEEPCQMLQL